MMNLGFTTYNYSWQKSISLFLTALEFFTDFFSGWFVFYGERFRHLPCAGFSVAMFSMTAITADFPNPVVVHSSLMLRWLSRISASTFSVVCIVAAAAVPVINFLFTSLKTTGPASELTFMESSPYTNYLYCCTVHFEDSLSVTHQRMH